jgi:predicted nucleic acid-binding protein
VNLLLDTNVLSEVQRQSPDLKVLGWLDAVDEDRVFISVASIAELRRGVALMDDGRRRAALTAWLTNDLMARSRRSGVALSVMDGFFAATALAKDLTLVTRNVKDFASFGVRLLDPWDG